MATTITHCTIEAGEAALNLDADDGHVVIMGEPPHAVATISHWIEEEGVYDEKARRWTTPPMPLRPVRKDRIIEAEVTTRQGVTTIKGQSEFLLNEVGAADYLVTLRIGPGYSCKTCR